MFYILFHFLCLHTNLQYSMMIAGNTIFNPDWHFGVWKIKWRNSTAETMGDVSQFVMLIKQLIINISKYNELRYQMLN